MSMASVIPRSVRGGGPKHSIVVTETVVTQACAACLMPRKQTGATLMFEWNLLMSCYT